MDLPKPDILHRILNNRERDSSFEEALSAIKSTNAASDELRKFGNSIGNAKEIIGFSIVTIGAVGLALGINWRARHLDEQRKRVAEKSMDIF